MSMATGAAQRHPCLCVSAAAHVTRSLMSIQTFNSYWSPMSPLPVCVRCCASSSVCGERPGGGGGCRARPRTCHQGKKRGQTQGCETDIHRRPGMLSHLMPVMTSRQAPSLQPTSLPPSLPCLTGMHTGGGAGVRGGGAALVVPAPGAAAVLHQPEEAAHRHLLAHLAGPVLRTHPRHVLRAARTRSG